MTEHANLDIGEIHFAHQWEYADETARLAATGFVAADVGKLALQLDDYSFHVLSDESPITWVAVGGGVGVTVPLTLTLEDAVTNDVTTILTVDHNTSGTPAIGLGAAVDFKAESSTTASSLLGRLKLLWRNVTHANRSADIVITVLHNGTEYIRAIMAGNFNLGGSATSQNGNARGQYANDFQGLRVGAIEVASGDYSTLAGGSSNRATATGSAVSGGEINAATGNHSAIPGGYANVASGEGAIAIGRWAEADKPGQLAHAGHTFSGAGDSQSSVFVLQRQITHGSTALSRLYIGPATGYLTIPSDTTWAFEALVLGATSGMAKSFSFHIRGQIENDGGTTALKGTPVVTVIDNSDDVSFSAIAAADDTNDALLIQVSDSDGAGDVVRWGARVTTIEITF